MWRKDRAPPAALAGGARGAGHSAETAGGHSEPDEIFVIGTSHLSAQSAADVDRLARAPPSLSSAETRTHAHMHARTHACMYAHTQRFPAALPHAASSPHSRARRDHEGEERMHQELRRSSRSPARPGHETGEMLAEVR